MLQKRGGKVDRNAAARAVVRRDDGGTTGSSTKRSAGADARQFALESGIRRYHRAKGSSRAARRHRRRLVDNVDPVVPRADALSLVHFP